MRYRVTLFTVAVLLVAVGRGHAGEIFSDDFQDYAASSNLVGQGGWTGSNVVAIGERDGNRFINGFDNSPGGTVDFNHPVDLYGGGATRVEMIWTVNMGLGDYPDAGNGRSHNFLIMLGGAGGSFGIHGDTNAGPVFHFNAEAFGESLLTLEDADMFGQESRFKIYAHPITGEIGGGYDPGNTGTFIDFGSVPDIDGNVRGQTFVDPNAVFQLNSIKIFLDYRGGSYTGLEIDNIVITPEPASLCLIGAGALALLIRRRRR